MVLSSIFCLFMTEIMGKVAWILQVNVKVRTSFLSLRTDKFSSNISDEWDHYSLMKNNNHFTYDDFDNILEHCLGNKWKNSTTHLDTYAYVYHADGNSHHQPRYMYIRHELALKRSELIFAISSKVNYLIFRSVIDIANSLFIERHITIKRK